jgi:DNA-binding transcriptional regulator YhcF (GntR family)
VEFRNEYEEAQMAEPPVDAQTLTDTGTVIFEAIATLEFTGRRPSRRAIAEGARLDAAVVDRALTEMTASGLLSRTEEDGEAVYVPARRDWSAQPGQTEGHPMA